MTWSLDRILAIVFATVSALLLLAVLHLNGALEDTRTERDKLSGAVEQQKKQAAALLAQRTAERDALQARINDNRRLQEISDANAQATIAAQASRLAALSRDGGGRGLRDPNAGPRDCRRDAPGEAAPSPGPGPGDAPEAPGLLSAQLERLLLRLTGEADAVNAAYASCRADALNVRGLDPIEPASPPPSTVVKEPP